MTSLLPVVPDTGDESGAPQPAPSQGARRRRRLPRLPRRTSRAGRAPRQASAPVEGTAALVSSSLTMLSLVCLWVAAQLLFLGGLSQQRDQDLLYGEFRTQLAGATAPIGPVIPPGDPVALVSIPRVGLEQVAIEGTSSGDMLAGPGHLRNTVLPGQAGTSVLMGRSTTYGGPFGPLTELVPGDVISVVVAQGKVDFTVVDVRRAGDPLPQPVAAGAARLTLVTAEGSGRLPSLRPDAAVFVDADAPEAFPAPPGLPAAVPDPEMAMASDPGATPLLALCLALLLALTLAVVAARQRWSTALVWVVASPLAVALSWQTTDVVMRLLPNLI